MTSRTTRERERDVLEVGEAVTLLENCIMRDVTVKDVRVICEGEAFEFRSYTIPLEGLSDRHRLRSDLFRFTPLERRELRERMLGDAHLLRQQAAEIVIPDDGE